MAANLYVPLEQDYWIFDKLHCPRKEYLKKRTGKVPVTIEFSKRLQLQEFENTRLLKRASTLSKM
jgi:hypothetical protein